MIVQSGTSSDSPARRGADIRTFLFADVRGYTRYTREHGDEAASELAARLAAIVREVVPDYHGDLFELRGDEAVCVFFSAREAIRAAVELQRRLREQRDGESSFPLGVGMGIDSGEAVPTEGGFRGGALNLAARLCAIAKPGQILASDHAAHLAGRVDGVRLVDRRPVRLKGMDRPVRLVEVASEVPLAPVPAIAPVRQAWWVRVTRRRMIVAGLVAVVLVGVLAGTGLFRGSPSRGELGLTANSLSAIDVGTNRVVAGVPVGGEPSGVAVGAGSVWDYPAPSAFLRVLFSCGAFKPHTATSLNVSEWCDPSLDAQMRRAGHLQTTGEVASANAAWSSIDHTITNQAPWVPLMNLTNADLVSKRVGNYTSNPYWGVLIDQMWVK